MTPRAEGRPYAAVLAAGAGLLIAAAAATAAGDADFTSALNVFSAQAVATASAQKLAAAQAQVPDLLARRVQPDFAFTPGHLCTASDPNFKEYRYAEHIPYCNRNVTEQMKETIAAHYGVPKSEWGNYEFDHLIPLAVGGDSSIDNVWPQPHGDPDGSQGKDKVEDEMYREMAAGTIGQADAVKQIYAWFGPSVLPGAVAAR
jgi:hypothetical protein